MLKYNFYINRFTAFQMGCCFFIFLNPSPISLQKRLIFISYTVITMKNKLKFYEEKNPPADVSHVIRTFNTITLSKAK